MEMKTRRVIKYEAGYICEGKGIKKAATQAPYLGIFQSHWLRHRRRDGLGVHLAADGPDSVMELGAGRPRPF